MERPRLLRELLAPLVLRDALHNQKQLQSIYNLSSGAVQLKFTDGALVECDAVIGGDGIWSLVREYVTPQEKASPSGWLECTVAVSSEDLKAALIDAPYGFDIEYHWMGNGLYILHALVGDRTQGLCLAVVVDEGSPTPSQPISRVTLEKKLATGQISHPVAQRITEVSSGVQSSWANGCFLSRDSLEAIRLILLYK
jgi:salicylate hydroxylase